MRHLLDTPDLPIHAFKKRGFGQRLATLEGGKGGSAPAAPDPYKVADATTQTNQSTAAFNKALNLNNYTNPFGSQQTTQVGTDPTTGAPLYQTSITANPQLQAAMTTLLGQAGSNAGVNAKVLNGLMGVGPNGMSQAQDAYYNKATSYLDPQFSQQEESLKASLANQGLTPGSEAYNNAMDSFNRQKTFAYNQAQDSAITQGQQLGLNSATTEASLAAQPYSELQTVASMIPGYSGPAQTSANPADIQSAFNNQYQGQLAGYNANVASQNQTMGGLFSLGAAALPFFL